MERGYFYSAWLFIWNIIKNSFVYKIVRRVYDCISNGWKNSKIAGWFRTLHINEDALSKTVAGRIFRSPFTFVEFLQKKFGEGICSILDKSFIVEICRDYLEFILAINLRFIGGIVAGIGLGLCFGGINAFNIICFFTGAVLSLFNVNAAGFLKHSALCKLLVNLFDIDTDFNWYQEKSVKTKNTIEATLIGLVFGVLGIVHSALPFLAVLGVLGVFMVLKSPVVGAFAVVFLAPILPTMAVLGLSLLCLFSLFVNAVITKDFKFKFDGLGLFVILFIAVYLFAAITSFAPFKSFTIWGIYFAFMAMYFVIINSVNSKKVLNNILITFAVSGFVVCLYGICQYLFGWDTNQAWMDEEMFEDIKMRIYSTLGNPNVLGEYILLVLPVSIGLMWTRKKAYSKIVYAFISAVMFLALILTFSRGCWLGIMLAAAIFITFAAGKLWGLSLIALPVLPMVLPESIINRFTSIGDMKDSSTSYRVYIWMGTLAMIKDFWISGIGMGQEAFTQVYPFYSYNGIVAPHSHNLFLQIMVESGIVGIGAFLIITALFLRRMMTGYQIGGKGNTISTMITAISAGVCGFLAQGMFDNCFYNYRVMLVFWCVLAIGRACVYVAKEDKQ